LSSKPAFTVILTLVLHNILCGAQVHQSARALSHSSETDPKALAIVKSAIEALGGEAWQHVGAAEAHLTIQMPGAQPTDAEWLDDWSNDYVRFRRTTTISGREAHSWSGYGSRGNGKVPAHSKPYIDQQNDVAHLAVVYPAAALRMSLATNCTFTFGGSQDSAFAPREGGPEQVIVAERCADPTYPGQSADFLWAFNKSSFFPISVEFSVKGSLHGMLAPEHVEYGPFVSEHGIAHPTSATITRPSGRKDVLTVTSVRTMTSIPPSAFEDGSN
jgi:hypothetical protein